MSKRHEHFPKKDYTSSYQAHENIVNIFICWGDINLNPKVIPLHNYWKSYNKRNIDSTIFCQRYGKIGSFIHCWWQYIVVQSLWKSLADSLKKLNVFLHTVQQLYSKEIHIPKKGKPIFTLKTCNQGFIAVLLEICNI